MTMNWGIITGGLGALLLLAPGAAQSATLTFASAGGASTEGIGKFSGSLQYANHQLFFTLKNENSSAEGGSITAFALMKPEAVTGVTLASSSFGLGTLLGGPAFTGSVSAPPFGSFDFGLSTASSWTGGGSPKGGIPAGGTGEFVFNLSGQLAGLTSEDFIARLSSPEGKSYSGSWLAVRFRGGLDPKGWRDKVVPGPPSPIPEPGAMALLGGALIALALVRRRQS